MFFEHPLKRIIILIFNSARQESPSRKSVKNVHHSPARKRGSSSSQSSDMSRFGPVPRCRDDSEHLPRSVDSVGIQASCCLSTTLMVCPVDKPSCEFRMRPTLSTDKGTGAQHRQALSPATWGQGQSGVFIAQTKTKTQTQTQTKTKPPSAIKA